MSFRGGASSDEATARTDDLLDAVLSGNVTLLDSVLSHFDAKRGNLSQNEGVATESLSSSELLSLPLTRRGVSGPALFWAGYAGRSAIIAYIQDRHPRVFSEQCIVVSRKLMDNQKDLAAVSILVRNKCPAAIIYPNRGETALHRLSKRTKPDAALMNELLKTYRKPKNISIEDAEADDDSKYDDVDALNNDGFSALMLVAMFSKGVDGKAAAQVLLSHGANILRPTANPKGGNARTLAQNPHVRSALSYKASPAPTLDEETRRIIDNAKSIFDLPPLPPLESERSQVSEATDSSLKINPQSATDDEMSLEMRAVKKLDKDAIEALIRRLHDQTLQLREEKSAARRQALEPTESRRLTAEEQQAVANRLCDESMEERAAKHEELLAKYVVEREPNPLDDETQVESAARLCNQSLDHKMQTMRALDERYYSPQSPQKRKVLSVAELKACASRLHDASIASSHERMAKLAEKYLSRSDASKGRSLSPTEREEARARLSQPRQR